MGNAVTKSEIIEEAKAQSALFWAEQIQLNLGSHIFSLENHQYQLDILDQRNHQRAPIQVDKKGAQMGISEMKIIDVLHGLRYGYYPQGVMYLFPTGDDVTDFSKARFDPLIQNNPEIAAAIQNTDSATIKRIGNAMLYFRSARSTKKIEGMKKTSSKLKTVPVDRVVFDEYDEMDSAMVAMAIERMAHSTVKHEDYLSTPTIPDYGIDKLYQTSDQKLWMITCRHCNTETCLEIEFPECLKENKDGKVYRACKKCGKEILPSDGRWVAQFPDRTKDIEGRWISQLNSVFVDPGAILKAFLNPPNGNLAEIYNSKLGMAYIAAENRLTANDLWAILGQYPMPLKHPGPTAMGVDVGNDFHVVILDRPYEAGVRLVKACHVSSKNMTDFSPLYDLIRQYNVKSCVIDFAPVQQKVRAFRESVTECEVFGNIYQEHQRGVVNWDSKEGIVRENRTEVCDATHEIVVNPGKFQLPRRSDAINEYIKQMCNIAKVLEEDAETGSREYRYRKLGADHYRHATNYAFIAAARIGVFVPPEVKKRGDAYATGDSESGSFMSA